MRDLYCAAVREYGQYCPVALGSEVLADRWNPLILRELILGNTRFNDIERCLPGISRSLLSQRLRDFERTGVIELRPSASGRGNEYHLTPAGADLEPVIIALGEWAIRWRFSEPQPADVDPVGLTWWMHRRLDVDNLPDERVVVEFAYTGPQSTTIWLVLDRGDPSVCVKHPGFDSDVVLTTDPLTMTRVFSGLDTFSGAVAEGKITLAGVPSLTRAFERWFLWSPFAPAVRRRLRAAGPRD